MNDRILPQSSVSARASVRRPTSSLPPSIPAWGDRVAPVFSSGPRTGHARINRRQRWILIKAELRYLGYALHALLRPLLILTLLTLLGTLVLHELGASSADGEPAPDWRHSFMMTYNMLLLEPMDHVPDSNIAFALTIILPLAGIFFVAEGVIKLGITVFNKARNQEMWMNALAQSASQHVILCGMGTVGYRVLVELHELGQQVFVVERDSNGPFTDLARHLGAHIVIGDARSEDLIRGLNLSEARALIVATDDDLANLEIAMDARDISKTIPIVMRLQDQRLANKVKATLGVNVSFSTAQLAAPLFASAALDPSIIGTHRVDGTLLVIAEIVVKKGSRIEGLTRGRLQSEHDLLLVAHRSPGEDWCAPPDEKQVVKAGDGLQVMLKGTRVRELHELNHA